MRKLYTALALWLTLTGLGFIPAVIRVRTKPGRTTITRAPVPRRASPRPRAKASSPAFADP